jgi:hypothetical protein
MKNIWFLLFITLSDICVGQQPGFRKLYATDSTGAGFVDIIWDGEKLITTGQFLTNTAPNGAINGLIYMELDTFGNTLFTDIYFHPNDAVGPGIGNSIYQSTSGLIYSMNQMVYDTSTNLLAIYENSERKRIVISPINARQSFLLNCIDWGYNLLFSGRIQNYQYDSEGMLIKADSLGNEIWRKYYGESGLDYYIAEPYIIDDNTIVLPGRKFYWPQSGPISLKWTKTWIVTVDSLGNVKSEWESPENVENGIPTRMLKMPNGNWLYTTSEFTPIPEFSDFGLRPKIVCRDNNFNLVWEQDLGNYPISINYTIDLQSTSDGNYIVAGRDVFSTSEWGSFICKFAPNGEAIWRYTNYCEPVEDCEQFLGGVVELPSGSIVAAGYVENFAEGKAYGLLIKLDKNGCIDTSCSGTTGTYDVELASKIKVYPNPTSDALNISNPIGERIEVFDMTGRLVRSVQVQGNNQILYLHDLPAGAYVVTMQEKNLRVSYQIIKQ